MIKYIDISHSDYKQLVDKTGFYHITGALQFWRWDGDNHREDGPAYISPTGSVFWFNKGLLHRTDGPAIKISNGELSWALDGVEYRKEEWFLLLTPEQLAIALSNPENF